MPAGESCVRRPLHRTHPVRTGFGAAAAPLPHRDSHSTGEAVVRAELLTLVVPAWMMSREDDHGQSGSGASLGQ
jgi:hypothetical protein